MQTLDIAIVAFVSRQRVWKQLRLPPSDVRRATRPAPKKKGGVAMKSSKSSAPFVFRMTSLFFK
jgi:hypothetical protein